MSQVESRAMRKLKSIMEKDHVEKVMRWCGSDSIVFKDCLVHCKEFGNAVSQQFADF
jgi:hypothetical protein